MLPAEPKRIAIWAGVVLVLCYCIYTLGAIGGERSKTPSPFGPVDSSAAPTTSLTIQVSGRVLSPGVYVLPSNSRVQDALRKAGGAAPDADVSALNLAGWLQDGAKIDVPARVALVAPAPVAPAPVAPAPTFAPPPFSPPAFAPTPIIIQNAPQVPPSNFPPSPAQASPATSPPGPLPGTAPTSGPNDAVKQFLLKNPVNLNTASAAQLELLPEIGPKMAARILDYRLANGPFRSPEDLRQIKGIGDKTMAALAPFICIR